MAYLAMMTYSETGAEPAAARDALTGALELNVGWLDQPLVAILFSEPFQRVTIDTIPNGTTFWWEASNK
jgi:hypothetical protein